MKHFKKILSPNIENIEKLLDIIAKCKTPAQLYSEIDGEIIKKFRPNKPKTILRIKFGGSYLFLKMHWRLSIVRTVIDLLQGNMTGCKEAKKYLILKKHKFKTPKLIAYGCIQNFFSFSSSYQITEEIEGAKTINRFLQEDYFENIVKNLSKLIWQLHKCKLIYGSELHHDNILVGKNKKKIELFLLDPNGLKNSSDFEKRLDDLLSFIIKNKKTWLNQNHIDLFLRNYYKCYSTTECKSLNYNDFNIRINAKLNENKFTRDSL